MEVIEALQVIIKNTEATQQAVVNNQDAIKAAQHAAAQYIVEHLQQAGVGTSADPRLTGYTVSPSTSSGGASQASSGASTGYSTPPPPPPGGGTPSGGGGGSGFSPQPGYNQPAEPGGQGAASAQPGLYGRLKSALGGGALTGGRYSGVLGLITEAYSKAVTESENAARYQGMEGGINRLQGANERRKEIQYALEQRARHGLSGMTVAEAQQAYADVTGFGYRDDPIRGVSGRGDPSRGAVLNFMANNKVSLGMSEGESTQVVSAMVGNTRASLAQLSDALHQVSDAAEHAGVSAMVARQNFLGMFNNLTQAGAGSSAAPLAAAATASLAGYGRDMQNIDTSAQFSMQWQYRAASNAGMSVGAYQDAMRTNPARVQGIIDAVSERGIENTVGRAAVQWIKERAKQSPYAGNIVNNPELLQNLADEYQHRFQPNLDRLMKVVQNTTGVAVGEDQVTRWVVGHILGMNASAELRHQNSNGGRPVRVDAAGNVTDAATGNAVSNGGAGLAATGSGNTGQSLTGLGGKQLDAAQKSYYDLAQSKGKGFHDPVLEGVLDKIKNHNQQVIVSVGGKHRKMSLADALHYYHEEVAKGDVIIADGDDKGRAVTDVAGVQSDSSRQTGGELTQQGAGASAGKEISSKDYDAIKAAAQNDSSGVGKLDLTDDAKKLLKLIPSASPSAGDAAAGSRPDPSGATSETVRGITPPYNYGPGGGTG